MDASASDEHRALHHAVLARDTAMVRLLMAHGADAHIGIYPHRVPTTPLAIATERGYDDIAAIIREAEATRGHVNRRYESASMPPPPPEFTTALNRGDERAVIAFLESSPLLRDHPELINRGPDGTTLLHLAAARLMPELASLGAVARRGCPRAIGTRVHADRHARPLADRTPARSPRGAERSAPAPRRRTDRVLGRGDEQRRLAPRTPRRGAARQSGERCRRARHVRGTPRSSRDADAAARSRLRSRRTPGSRRAARQTARVLPPRTSASPWRTSCCNAVPRCRPRLPSPSAKPTGSVRSTRRERSRIRRTATVS